MVPHRTDWGVRAEGLKIALNRRLGPSALRTEHIGSTAIPRMAAKDVIDLQVSVSDLTGAESYDDPLGELGFRRSPFERDHVPSGLDPRPDEWAKRLWLRRGEGDFAVNLHVRRAGAANERLALLFRDWFRSHPDAVPAYGTFKERLAGVTPTVDSYADIKDPVVDLIVVIAERWAAATGWTP